MDNNRYTYLIDHPTNRENLYSLFDTFERNRDIFVPFIGAGISTITGASGWKDLLLKMIHKHKVDINTEDIEAKNDTDIDFPKLFSELFRKSDKKNDFYKDLFGFIEPTDYPFNPSLSPLIKTFNFIVTTNYDKALETLYKEFFPNNKLTKHFFSSYPNNNILSNHNIVYLHGYKDINFAIIKSEDYEYFYPSEHLGIPIIQDFLDFLFTNNIVIFIGFSFNDKYIKKYFEYLSTKYKNKKHYILIPIEENIENAPYFNVKKYYEEEFNRYKKINIYPIIFNEKIFIYLLFKELNNIKIAKKEVATAEPKVKDSKSQSE